jgi:hypothetical protein
MFSKESVELFEQLLANYSLQANHPDFMNIAQRIINARNELESYHAADETAKATKPEDVAPAAIPKGEDLTPQTETAGDPNAKPGAPPKEPKATKPEK